jgi:hypothetical protein
LLRLAPGAEVKTHADIYRHWFYRTRVHIPINTLPPVEFTCDGESVHMAAGECWIFDNWRQHAVRNPTDLDRIHLVADTSGDAHFWEFVARGLNPAAPIEYRSYQENDARTLLVERYFPRVIMSLHGEDPDGRAEFVALRERVRVRLQAISTGLIMRTNHVAAQRLLEARILRVCVLG